MQKGVWILTGQEVFIMKEELTGADYKHSVIVGSIFGFVVGCAIGVALLLYLDSTELNNWPWVASIPIWEGLGWATYGFVVGGSGMFAHVGRRAERPVEQKTSTLEPAA
jgi:hypothetical protein